MNRPPAPRWVTDHGPHLRRTPGTEILPVRSDTSAGCEATLASPVLHHRPFVSSRSMTAQWEDYAPTPNYRA